MKGRRISVTKDEADAAYQILAWAMNRGEYDFGESRPAVARRSRTSGRFIRKKRRIQKRAKRYYGRRKFEPRGLRGFFG